ncbi:sigma-54-dependent Fis family transcriptional regulator [Pollutimonas nitritireducens]|uniref:Sigma-54-dependent Fis family transcriptional regulator n=1 Tax=Pollutimonas nitritireducens TaxID=2045209 RepID=A0A2N4UFW2_9BURK|nr:sigma-54-dependent Fis family transcriptional regulator [Pollutimonas nitritireducens]PLC53911.1 sigma-54-dependent Fis family transcriptional regulator [Pollutimonas nitritireducens]
MVSVHSHGARVREVVESSPAPYSRVPPHITESWIRCISEYQLDPTIPHELYVVESHELLERQEQVAPVMRAAKSEMTVLFQQIAKSDYAIMLTDTEGVLLNFFGDPGFTHAASKSGLMPGAVWSERFQGTNGMGTCLAEQRPMMIHQDDHFLFRNTGLTCAAAPIFDWRGQILAVLDASGETHRVPSHVLDLVNMTVQEIENKVFVNEFSGRPLFVFHSRPEFVGTLNKGIIALDSDSCVLAASRNCLAQLGVTSNEIIGQPLDALFNVSFKSLLRESQKHGPAPFIVFDAHHGRRFFATATSGQSDGKSPLQVFATQASAPTLSNVPASDRLTPLYELQRGHDARMEHNIQTAMRVFDRDVAILLCGETGTGKELFAKAIHLSSNRADQPYVAINCASIPEQLIESELFGYKPGAFTGANKEGQIGKICQANGGTLFLDEIGDMPLALQTRLLRVLEEREIAPLGGKTPTKLDIRLISATHCDLPEKIANNLFREDLYYRIQGVTLTLPPLRERADRKELIQFVLEQESPDDGIVTISDELMDLLERHQWPGNIRQLRNVLRVMMALRDGNVLTRDCLPADFLTGPKENSAASAPITSSLLNPLELAEREALIQELRISHWNLSKLARQLKVSRNTLYRKLERLDINVASREAC